MPARKPFAVIDAEILNSSIWSEAPHVRLVWITLLLICDTDGVVWSSVPGVARDASVNVELAAEALARLQEPDPYSRTKANDGRRIEPVERGWRILNFREHLDRIASDRAKSRDRMKRFRQRVRDQRRREAAERDARLRNGDVTVTGGNREQGIGNREQGENGRTDAVPSESLSPATSLPEFDERSELNDLCGRIASRQRCEVRSVMQRVSAIPASFGHAAKRFSDPWAKGISIEWVRSALERARELEAEMERPVPL